MSGTGPHPRKIGSKRLGVVAGLLANPWLSIVVGVTTFLLPWLGVLAGLIPATVYRDVVLAVAVIVLIGGVLFPYLLRLSRYSLLDNEIRSCLGQLPIGTGEDIILVGAGAGSFKAIGMILKAWDDLKPDSDPPPDCLCVGLAKKAGGDRTFYPPLDEISSVVNHKRMLIVLAHVGTGRTANHLRAWAKKLATVERVEVFSLTVSETAADTGDWKDVFTLVVTNRKKVNQSILPWSGTGDEH